MTERRRKRILLACFSCSPLWGSEPGVGWNWLKELSRLHDVTLVTHEFYRTHLEPALAEQPLEGVEVFYSRAWAAGRPYTTFLNSRLYYLWWQINLYFFVRRLVGTRPFDLIHHLTWGTVRFPSFLGFLGIPFVIGPLGGGDVAPRELLSGQPFVERAFENVRSLSLKLFRLDAVTRAATSRARLIFCKTDATMYCLPASLRRRAQLAFEIGTPPIANQVPKPFREAGAPLRLLFAGRLVGLKGVSIAIAAVGRLRARGIEVSLDIAGDGPLRHHLARQITDHQLTDHVRILGMLPREELFLLYEAADVFVFPSLRDSSGNVILEALSRQLPVVCLDLAGPKYYVSPECGVVVSTGGLSRSAVEDALASAIASLARDPEQLARLSRAALSHARAQTWAYRVTTAYDRIAETLGW
jgi:glycosyltransferase involved in cell wall biosynthesis